MVHNVDFVMPDVSSISPIYIPWHRIPPVSKARNRCIVMLYAELRPVLTLFSGSDMKASLFERGRGVANNATTDSHVERMTAVMHSVVLAPQIFFRLFRWQNRKSPFAFVRAS